ncbi:hypothetical protein AB6A40_001049 [Gnathostoma spinigerum]|uniref:Uncharacterized protein n=1 Tax=Gnathostoma spinigerum TaxID=75299 RepID=A0ABD6EDF6_9BILA
MIPSSKITKPHVPPTLFDKKRREKERLKAIVPKKKYPSDVKSRFGAEFQSKMLQLFLSDDSQAIAQMEKLHQELVSYYEEHNISELWLSDDESDSVKAPASKKMHQEIMKMDPYPITLSRTAEKRDKLKLKSIVDGGSLSSSSGCFEMSDESEDDRTKKSHTVKTFRMEITGVWNLELLHAKPYQYRISYVLKLCPVFFLVLPSP